MKWLAYKVQTSVESNLVRLGVRKVLGSVFHGKTIKILPISMLSTSQYVTRSGLVGSRFGF